MVVVVDWPSEEPVDAGILLLGTVVVVVFEEVPFVRRKV